MKACWNCSALMDDRQPVCPNCGAPQNSAQLSTPAQSKNNKALGIIAAIVLVITLFPVFSGILFNSKKQSNSNPSVSLSSYEFSNETLTVYYKFTNNKSKPLSFAACFSDYAFQNNVECTCAMEAFTDSDGVSKYSDIQPHSTVTVKCIYYLQDDSPVTIRIYRFLSDTVYITKTLKKG